MMYYRFSILLFLFSLFFFSCKSEYTIYDAIKDTPAKLFENYTFDDTSEFLDRINVSDEIVLDYIQNMDQNFDYSFYELNYEERAQLKEYFSLLPSLYQDVLQKKLIGIYFIQDFLGSGLTDYVLSENGEIYTILILNPIVLHSSISELLTYKENSCFSSENEKYSLSVQISNDYSGLFYILMHESTHIVDYIKRLSPYVEPNMKELEMIRTSEAPFISQYWNDYRELKDFLSVSYQEKIHFYTNSESEKISNEEMIDLYREFKTTPFVSVYSYNSWAEDLAEYITFYHFTENLGMEYKIKILEDDVPVLEYEPFKNDLVSSRVSKIDLKIE